MKVYISGPITGIENYMEIFAAAEEYLKNNGCVVLNQAKFNAVLPADFDYSDYMRLDFAMIDISDAIYMLPGWSDSRGAQAEYRYAEVLGKRIIYSEATSGGNKYV